MATRIYKRGTIWWASYPEGGTTVRRSTKCTTKEAARAIVASWELERADPDNAAKKASKFVDESAVFLADVTSRPKVPDGTVNMYKCKVGHLNRLMPERTSSVDAKAIDAYFQRRKDEGASGSTMHKEWIALRGILKTAARRGHWSGQLDILKPTWVSPASAEKTRNLSWEELDALLAAISSPSLVDLVKFAVATGSRRAELGRAREGDVSPDWRVLIRGTKTKRAWRSIPVPPLFRHLIPSRAIGASAGKLMFPELPDNLRCLNSACRAARIEPVSYNDLRRSFSTLLVKGGATNTVVAKLMRHASTAMVDKFYDRTDDDGLQALVESQAPVRLVYVSECSGAQHIEAEEAN